MMHPGDGHDQTHPDSQPQTAPTVNPADLAKALKTVERQKGRKKMGRRVLLGVAGLGICAGAVELTPLAVDKLGRYTEAQVHDAFNSGIEAGRQALLDELAQLEGVTIQSAIGVAELTRLAVRYIVIPLANLTTTIEGDALAVLINAVANARSTLAHFNVTIDWLDRLQTLLTTWHDNIIQLPKALNAYANADIDGAEAYLKALQAKIAAEQTAHPTATP